MSEFGRTARQNGTGGTDHGHGNVMFVLGGSIKGGKVYGRWPGLDDAQLNEGRDLAVTTDFPAGARREATYQTLGYARPECTVFPGAALIEGTVPEVRLIHVAPERGQTSAAHSAAGVPARVHAIVISLQRNLSRKPAS